MSENCFILVSDKKRLKTGETYKSVVTCWVFSCAFIEDSSMLISSKAFKNPLQTEFIIRRF